MVDSTAGILPAVAEGQRITVVPLTMVVDGRETLESVTQPSTVVDALAAERLVGTVSPGVDRFVEAYQELGRQGFDEIVSVHIPQTLSSTLADAAAAAEVMAAENGPLVHVVDGQLTGMGLGWVALTAAGAAESHLTGREVRDLAIRIANRTLVLYCVGDLGHWQRTGRMGSRKLLVGSAMGVHPVIRLQRGENHSAGSPLSLGRAIDRMMELALNNACGWPVHVTVQHFAAETSADILRHRILEAGLDIRGDVDIVQAPPSVGAYVGAGAVGLVVSPIDWLLPD